MIHAIIMAGGTGKRFWPQSRKKRPKQVLSIGGPRPMIAETLARLEGLVPIERTTIVTNEDQVAPIMDGVGLGPPPRIIAEPFGRDTAACIGLAAVHVRHVDPEGVMLVLPADQVIGPPDRYREVMTAGVEIASQSDALVTFGIKPPYAATGYGYVHRGQQVAEVNGAPVFEVLGFREKPSREVAEEYLESGDYYWNSGIFCWKATTILDCLERFTPDLYAALTRIEAAIGSFSEDAVLREQYEPLERISIDYAVMEKAETIRVVEADFDWSDVGSWASVARLRAGEADGQGNVTTGACELIDVEDTLVLTDDKHLVGVIGLRDVIVVHTADATLVCSRDQAEHVKQLVDGLERKKLDAYL